MADITVYGNQSYFNEDAKFFKNVNIYGDLYAEKDFYGAKNISIKGDIEGLSSLLINQNLYISGISTFNSDAYFVNDVNVNKKLRVNEYFSVGIGSTVLNANSLTGSVGINSVEPQQKLDVIGSIKISKDIYDSLNSSGNVGGFLTKDAQGIKWVDFEPAFTEGFFVYNDGVLVGVGSFKSINVVSGINTNGINTDPVQAYISPLSPNIADIVVTDLWGANETNEIYRFTNVGINTNNPVVALDVRGDVYFSGISSVINLNSNNATIGITSTRFLNVYNNTVISGITTIGSDLNVSGNTFIGGFLNVFDQTSINSLLYVSGETILNNTLLVNSTTQSTSKDTGAVIIEGGVGIEKNVNVGGALNVSGLTRLFSALQVSSDATVFGGFSVSGPSILSNTLRVDGNVTLNSLLEVNQNATFNSDFSVYGSTNLYNSLYVQDLTRIGSNLEVYGTGFFEGETFINALLTVNGQANINGPAVISGTLDVNNTANFNSDLNVNNSANINSNLYVTGLSTFVGVGTFNDDLYVDGNLYVKDDLLFDELTARNANITGITTVNILKVNQIDASGVSTFRSRVDIGAGGTVFRATESGTIGFGVQTPTREIDINRDVRLRQAVFDTNNNVGYKTDFYQVPRSVLTTVGIGSNGEFIGGRFFDAANMIRLNLDFIAEEAVGYILSTDYKNPTFTLSSGDYTSCKDDIKDIFKAITIDLTKGGNIQSVGAGLSYYNGNTLVHITGTDINGYSIKDASIAAIGAASTVARYVINNANLPKSYQPRPISGINADASRLLQLNKDFIATEAVDRTLDEYPSLVIPGGNQNCIDDIKLILDAIVWNIQFGGNDRVFDAASFYINNPTLLDGEQEESIYAYERVRDVAIQVIRNATVTKVSGILNTYTQYKDLTIIGDYSGVAGVYQVAPSGIYYDASNLIIANRQEIKDKSLAAIAINHPDFYFPGDSQTNSRSRYYDAYRLIQNNKNVIVGTAFTNTVNNPGFSGFDFASVQVKCKRDLGYFIDAISTDIFTGGNKYSRDFTLQYFSGGSPISNGLVGEETESVYAFNQARDLMRQAVTNTLVGAAYSDLTISADPLTGSNTSPSSCADVQNNIDNLVSIVTTVIGAGSTSSLSSFNENLGTFTTGGTKCARDIGYIIDAVATDVRDYTNENSVNAAEAYFNNGYPISNGLVGEEVESITAFHAARDLMKLAITNNLNTKDLSIAADPLTGSNVDPSSCASVQSFIDNLVGIITTPIGSGNLNSIPSIAIDCNDQASAITQFVGIVTYAIGNSSLPSKRTIGVSSTRQIKDLTLQDDPNVGFNTDPFGCANVASAIHTYAGIVTTIIGRGPSFAPSITEPDGKVIWSPPGADSKNTIWVTKYGSDSNGGRTEGDAKLTIAAAVEIAQPGDTIFVRPGVYYENNPIGLRTDVAVSGQDLRLVTVIPLNLGKDLFHVRRGCLIENMNFNLETGQENIGGAVVAFPPTPKDVKAGIAYSSVTGYVAPGPANEGPSGRWRSPYVRNCTNFMKKSIGMKIDGNHATGSTIGADLKCMVLDAFTQYNEAGIGVSITNSGYAQLVSLFTICCDKAVYATSGGACDLTNSNSSFGNYGLYADGLGALEFTAQLGQTADQEADILTFHNVSDNINNPRRPYDGQALYFKVPVNGVPIDQPFQQLDRVIVTNGGDGYSSAAPPNVVVRDSDGSIQPKGLEGIVAEVSPTIDDITGQIVSIDVINSGRNYLSTQNIVIDIEGGGGATAEAIMSPIYYTVSAATKPTEPNGRYADAVNLIMENLDFIATEAVDRMLYYYNVTLGSPFFVPAGSQSCVDDIKLVLDAIAHNVQFGGNDKTYDAAEIYFTNPYLQGEEAQSIYAYHAARDLVKNVINNVTITKQNYTSINTFDQVFDLSLVPDPVTGSNTDPASCADVRSTIDNLVGIVTFAIRSVSPQLPNTRTIGNTVGISTVTLNEFVPYPIPVDTDIQMFRISRILTSGHSFEFIGAGTDINISTPPKGGVPIKANEVVAINGAQIPYTSTDQAGNFNIGGGIQISQTTASIAGRDFNRSIQAQVTPLILALS